MTPSSFLFTAAIVFLAIVMQLNSGDAFATSPPIANESTTDGQVKNLTNPEQFPDIPLSQLQQKMPNLKQALIIFTSLNGILIVFGAAALVLRKRLDDQSASTLASIKATQSRIPVR